MLSSASFLRFCNDSFLDWHHVAGSALLPGGHSVGGEWEGVAGTVTAKLGKRLDERAAKTDAALMHESQRRTEYLSEQIM